MMNNIVGNMVRNKEISYTTNTQNTTGIKQMPYWSKFGIVLLYVMGMTAVSWFFNGRSLVGIDDANIYFVYMDHFANGHGFVYNEGGERVEGFTSLLWTLIGSVCYMINDNVEYFLLAINLLVISFSLFSVVNYIDSKTSNRAFSNSSLLFLGLLSVVPGYFDWAVLSLMETGLWSFMLVALTLYLMEIKNIENLTFNVVFNLLIAAIIVCRPESMLWGLCFIGLRFLLLLLIGNRSWGKALMPSLFSAAVFGATLFCLISWRISYFGFPLPNTYYAKVSTDLIVNFIEGIKYINNCFQNNPPILLTLVLVPYLVIRNWSVPFLRTNYDIVIAFAVCLITLLIPLLTGGDHFGYSRFLQPTLPIFYLLIVVCLYKLKVFYNRYALAVILLIVSFLPAHSYYSSVLNWRNPIFFEWKISESGRENSILLNTFFEKLPELPVQGVIAAGGSAYEYEGETLDLLGLNNVEIAHAKKEKNRGVLKNHASFSKNLFFKLQPDLFWYSGWYKNNFVNQEDLTGEEKLDVMLFIKQVFLYIDEDQRFIENYKVVMLVNEELKQGLRIVASNDFLNSLSPEIYSYYEIPINYVNQ